MAPLAVTSDTERRFACLMYHDIRPDRPTKYCISNRAFQTHLSWLLDEGFLVEGLSGLKARMLSGAWPPRYCLVTFDDGHKSLLNAAETLFFHGIRATYFLTKNLCCEREDFLHERNIRQLSTIGDIGAHGVSHKALSALAHGEAVKEMAESKEWLEQCIGKPVVDMSPPGGFWCRRLQKSALALGYHMVGTSREWWNTSRAISQSGMVARIAIRDHHTIADFVKICDCAPTIYWQRRIRSAMLYLPKRAYVLSERIC